MRATLIAQGQGDQPERDLLLEYVTALDSEDGHEVTRFLNEHIDNKKFIQTTLLLHEMFDPDMSFTEQLIKLRRRRG